MLWLVIISRWTAVGNSEPSSLWKGQFYSLLPWSDPRINVSLIWVIMDTLEGWCLIPNLNFINHFKHWHLWNRYSLPFFPGPPLGFQHTDWKWVSRQKGANTTVCYQILARALSTELGILCTVGHLFEWKGELMNEWIHKLIHFCTIVHCVYSMYIWFRWNIKFVGCLRKGQSWTHC